MGNASSLLPGESESRKILRFFRKAHAIFVVHHLGANVMDSTRESRKYKFPNCCRPLYSPMQGSEKVSKTRAIFLPGFIIQHLLRYLTI